MGRGFGDFNALTDAFMAAAMDSARWDAAMDVAAEATGSFGALLQPLSAPAHAVPMSQSLRAGMEAYARTGWFARDERYRSVPTLLRRGVACDFDYTTAEEMARSPFYQEFLIPSGGQWFAAVKVGDTGDKWGLALQRSPAQGPFSPAELARLAKLSRSLASAGELAQAFGFARMEAAFAAFETSGSAVAAVNRAGDVVRLNAAAERLLGPDLAVVRRRISSFSREATAALDRALHALLWARQPEAFREAVILPRREGRPILAYASRLSGPAHDAFAACSGFVVFADLDARLACSEADLAHAFGLTRAEARLANALLREAALEGAAARVGVSAATARNQLQAVFHKSGTHAQAELVALLARLARTNAD
jgi:PAS domain-containing protein